MDNRNRKDFLNRGILGDGAGVPRSRGFRNVNTQYLGKAEYKAHYFEAFPTLWANAYAFQKSLDSDTQSNLATEEWMAVFLLHYFGIIYLANYTQAELTGNYDRDLWLALSGTYPKPQTIASVMLLQTNRQTVVGAYYPDIIFFPSRGRSAWSNDETLKPFLVGRALSWDLCAGNLLTTQRKIDDFHAHLRRVVALLRNRNFQDKINNFCNQKFGQMEQVAGRLSINPMDWQEIPGLQRPLPQSFLQAYPLKKGNDKGGTDYYLICDMPSGQLTSWMTQTLISGVSPYDYREAGANAISVPYQGNLIVCPIEENDSVIKLNELFLADVPYWCKVSKTADCFSSQLRRLHSVDLRDPVLKQDEFALCLAPIKREFLQHFPETFANHRAITVEPDPQQAKVEWTIPILEKEVKWLTMPMAQTDMPKATLALWPPRVSPDWHLYVAYGTGSKESCGRWGLIDEKGNQGANTNLEEEEYVSILQPTGKPNTPRGLLFTDNKDKERGILFLADFNRQDLNSDPTKQASLAVDFGTSNTCLAAKVEESETLTFSISPLMLWGEKPELENPGFVPFRWSGEKGFYPTILLTRRSSGLEHLRSQDIRVDHLFHVDIPGLHAEMEEGLFYRNLTALWQPYWNMKWTPNPHSPWRALFLRLTLLYAHAELFFNGGQGRKINQYVFTFPLAFTTIDRQGFHEEAKRSIRNIRQLCYGEDPNPLQQNFTYFDRIDESTSAARTLRAAPLSSSLKIFIDVGGGTADIAIQNAGTFLVLDSIKVAGNTFFRFTEKHFDPSLQLEGAPVFKKHLASILLNNSDGQLDKSNIPRNLNFSTFYSLAINGLKEEDFKAREAKVIQDGMANEQSKASFQRYRTRLFFRHILAYALLQACAAAVDKKLHLTDGLELVLGGNAWGLLLFAEFRRSSSEMKSEAENILGILKKYLAHSASEEEMKYIADLSVSSVELMNEDNLSNAKTSVAIGALTALSTAQGTNGSTMPYTGITVTDLSINGLAPITVRWRDRWGFQELKKQIGFGDEISETCFQEPESLSKPSDAVLSIFTSLGNSRRSGEDNMPVDSWRKINSEVGNSIKGLRGESAGRSPINYFISKCLYPEDEQRDFLDDLAKENGHYTVKQEPK
jgi:hypothetical protein